MRTFIHVTDIARSFIFAIDNIDKMNNNIYNVGHETMNFSKQEVCQKIVDKTDAFVHFEEIGEDADKRNYIVSYFTNVYPTKCLTIKSSNVFRNKNK